MPRRLATPAYRLHRPTGQAVVSFNRRDFYLGKFGTPESRAEYDRLVAEWLSNGRRLTPKATEPADDSKPARSTKPAPVFTIHELVAAYWKQHVTTYYVKDGRPTSEQDNIRQALRFVIRLYGHIAAKDFGPIALKTVRQAMIEAGRCRTLINKDIHRVRAAFRWAVGEELYPGASLANLVAVTALEKGRSAAKEQPPVSVVAEEIIERTLPHLSPQVAAMVELQLRTAARPGEIMALRPRDVDRSDPSIWVYRPESHKTEHHGKERVILIGPRGQAVLLPWLDRDPDAYCFSPYEVIAEQLAKTSPATTAKRPKPGGRYTRHSYRVAVARGCLRAGVPEWTPHQIRHTRATEIRREFDLEAAQVVLGHSKPDTTLIYAARDIERAREVMKRTG
jgi:integrase